MGKMPKNDIKKTFISTDTVRDIKGKILSQTRKTHEVAGVDYYLRFYKSYDFKFHLISKREHVLVIAIKEFVSRHNYVDLGSMNRGIIASRYGLSVDIINHTVSMAMKSGILFKTGNGKYIVNPYIYGCGKDGEIDLIRSYIDYDEENNKWSFDYDGYKLARGGRKK